MFVGCTYAVLWSFVSCVMDEDAGVVDEYDADKDGCIRGADSPGGRFPIARSLFLPF